MHDTEPDMPSNQRLDIGIQQSGHGRKHKPHFGSAGHLLRSSRKTALRYLHLSMYEAGHGKKDAHGRSLWQHGKRRAQGKHNFHNPGFDVIVRRCGLNLFLLFLAGLPPAILPGSERPKFLRSVSPSVASHIMRFCLKRYAVECSVGSPASKNRAFSQSISCMRLAWDNMHSAIAPICTSAAFSKHWLETHRLIKDGSRSKAFASSIFVMPRCCSAA